VAVAHNQNYGLALPESCAREKAHCLGYKLGSRSVERPTVNTPMSRFPAQRT
jgi:hypothetical protein